MALLSALNRFDMLPFFSGLRWLSVHSITLGGLTQLIFGLLPTLAGAVVWRNASSDALGHLLALNWLALGSKSR